MQDLMWGSSSDNFDSDEDTEDEAEEETESEEVFEVVAKLKLA